MGVAVAQQLDKLNAESLSLDEFPLEDKVVEKLRTQFKYKNYVEVVHKARELHSIVGGDYTQVNWKTAYDLVNRCSHPIFGLIYWYDAKFDRVTRVHILTI